MKLLNLDWRKADGGITLWWADFYMGFVNKAKYDGKYRVWWSFRKQENVYYSADTCEQAKNKLVAMAIDYVKANIIY